VNNDVKSQPIRILDVVLIGPLMSTGGLVLWRSEQRLLGGLLIFFGVTTMAYNARNYVRVAQRSAR
jgi:hypothetical protein